MICDICQKKIDYDDIHKIEIRESLGGSDWSALNMVETFKVCGECRKDVLEYIENKKTKTQICKVYTGERKWLK